MAKETVRYPDALVSRIEAFVDDSAAFESKSEYHRFASEFLLSLLEPGHEPSVLGYGEIYDDLGDLDDVLGGGPDDAEPFLETYIRVRRHLLHGEVEAARGVVDERYDVADREALLLDEVIGQSLGGSRRPAAAETREQATGVEPDSSSAANGRVQEREAESSAETGTEETEKRIGTPSSDETAVESEY